MYKSHIFPKLYTLLWISPLNIQSRFLPPKLHMQWLWPQMLFTVLLFLAVTWCICSFPPSEIFYIGIHNIPVHHNSIEQDLKISKKSIVQNQCLNILNLGARSLCILQSWPKVSNNNIVKRKLKSHELNRLHAILKLFRQLPVCCVPLSLAICFHSVWEACVLAQHSSFKSSKLK